MMWETLPEIYKCIKLESKELQTLSNSEVSDADNQAGKGTGDAASCWVPILPVGLALRFAKRGLS